MGRAELSDERRFLLRNMPPVDTAVGVEGLAGGPCTTVVTALEDDRARVEQPRVGGKAVRAPHGRKVRLQYRRAQVPCTATGVIEETDAQGFWLRITELERLQRRSFVRVPVQIDAVMVPASSTDQEPTAIPAALEDLSAGGTRARSKLALPHGSEITLVFALPVGMLRLAAQIVHVAEAGRPAALMRFQYGIEFLDLTRDEEEELIRYTFARQRELRRREVGLS